MKKILCFVFALALMLCACAKQEAPLEIHAEEPLIAEDAPEASPAPMPTPSPEPTPIPLADRGKSELLRFENGENGEYMDYWLRIPDNAVEGMPVLVFLHGDGNVARPESLENNAISSAIEEIYGGEAPFILLMPNTRTASWTAGNIPQNLISLIEYVADSYAADKDKIMLSGHSRGAIGTWYYISAYPELFSAAVPISCGCDELLSFENMAKVPVWGFCGDVGQDGSHYLPAMERIAASINEAGGSAKIDVLQGCDHAASEKAAWTKEVFTWLISQ